MTKNFSEYIYLDGLWLRREQLLQLAMGVGNYAQAEHYLFALLADAVVKGKREAILEVNKVREHYGVRMTMTFKGKHGLRLLTSRPRSCSSK